MSTICLVDSENDGGQVSVVKNLLNTKPSTKIAVFTSSHTSPAVNKLVKEHPSKMYALWCENGHKNAMDFCIATYVGKVISEHPNNEYLIYSNDSGYDAIVQFWTMQGKKIRRVPSHPAKPKKKTKACKLDKKLQKRVWLASVQSGISFQHIVSDFADTVDYKAALKKQGYAPMQIKRMEKCLTKSYRRKLRLQIAAA